MVLTIFNFTCIVSELIFVLSNKLYRYLTLSAHAREGYSSHFVCHSLTLFSILEKAPFSRIKLTSAYILGDDLSALNVALF